MVKIAIIYSAYPEIAEAAEELIRKKGFHIELAIGVLDNAVELAKKYQAEGFDLIISRGVTGSLIRSAVNIPVIMVDITNFDILRTLAKARKYGKKLAFFQYSKSLKYHDFDFIREVLNLNEEELLIFPFATEEELKDTVNKACNSAVDVIITTGAYTMEFANQQGLKTFMVRSTKEAIYNAFEQAEDILSIQDDERELNHYFRSIAEESFAGLVLLDTHYNIRYISDSACNLFKINSRLGLKNYTDLCNVIPSLKDFTQLKNNAQISFQGMDLLINKMALRKGDEVTGYAIKFEHFSPPIAAIGPQKDVSLQNKGLVARYDFSHIIGESESITKVISKAKSYGKTDLTILITGESGTGKEVMANSIHNTSTRNNRPFVAVNCATLPQSLLESELFGYEDGAFTGAKRGGRQGLFELAQGGTIFLDEVSEITLTAQAQLLRVLQEKVIRRIGGDKIIPVDVRVIAASNADLLLKVRSGQFREDLFYRINVLNLRIPPLRERKEDIPLLINSFVKRHSRNHQSVKIPDVFIKKLQDYTWPGNVRELENFVERLAVLSQDEENIYILLEELYSEFSNYTKYTTDADPHSIKVKIDTLKKMELQIIETLFARYASDKSALARRLGISRSNLWSKLKELGKEDELINGSFYRM